MSENNGPLLTGKEALEIINQSLKQHNSIPVTVSRYKLTRSINSMNADNKKTLTELKRHYRFFRSRTPYDKEMPDYFESKSVPEYSDSAKNQV